MFNDPTYKRYVLILLTVVYMMNYTDRYVVGVMLQSIKEDLLLTDTQLGFLSGIAFALFYSTLGIPIARWADRGNRVTIASVAVALWGGMVMLCGLASNFAQLALTRVGAGVGEAGCMPPTYSLLGDYFPGRERMRAMSIYMMAPPLAGLVGFAAGGWLNELYGWRTTLLLAGIPGLLVAPLVRWTVSEPRLCTGRALGRQPLSLREVFITLWTQRSFRHLIIAFTLLLIVGVGFAPWYAVFLIRSHGMTSGDAGVWMGLIFSIFGGSGVFVGGYLADRYLAGKEGTQMRISAVTLALLVPFYAIFLLASPKYVALVTLVPLAFVFNIFIGPVFALMQRLVVSGMRATALAVVMLVANLVGMGLGPQAVGILSDLWAPTLGTDSLRMAMLAVSFVVLWSAYHFWAVGRTVHADLAATQIHENAMRPQNLMRASLTCVS